MECAAVSRRAHGDAACVTFAGLVDTIQTARADGRPRSASPHPGIGLRVPHSSNAAASDPPTHVRGRLAPSSH